jgi:magnesium chelatase accessory protein
MRYPPAADWPHAAASQQIASAPHRWHVQVLGQGPQLLFLHGAGGSTHSFRDLMSRLSADFTTIAVDLPGQGFTQLGARHRSGLEETAQDLARLLEAGDWQPHAIIGHSAGGALALRLAGHLDPALRCRVIGINPALSNFKGLAGVLFPAMAKALALTPFSAELFSRTSSSRTGVNTLIRSTGSEIDAEGITLYQRLLADRDHVDGTLLMMAQWSLDALNADLPGIDCPTLFLAGQRDAAVPPSVAQRAALAMPDATFRIIDGVGHLAHEEQPALFSDLIARFATEDPAAARKKGAEAPASAP